MPGRQKSLGGIKPRRNVPMSDTGLQSAAKSSESFVDHKTIVAESGAFVSRLSLSGASNMVNAENSDRYVVLDHATPHVSE